MESRTIVVFDSSLWFIKVATAMLLFVGISDSKSIDGYYQQSLHSTTAEVSVELVKKPPVRSNHRRLASVRYSLSHDSL